MHAHRQVLGLAVGREIQLGIDGATADEHDLAGLDLERLPHQIDASAHDLELAGDIRRRQRSADPQFAAPLRVDPAPAQEGASGDLDGQPERHRQADARLFLLAHGLNPLRRRIHFDDVELDDLRRQLLGHAQLCGLDGHLAAHLRALRLVGELQAAAGHRHGVAAVQDGEMLQLQFTLVARGLGAP